MGTPKTPAPSKKRKSLSMQAAGSATLDSPIRCINSMRRSSIGLVTSTPVVLQTNDDEAERRNWKRLSLLQEEPAETRKTQTLPLNTLEEFLGNWVRMSVENKINAKNVWKIHIIDYLRLLVDKNSENPLQLATASLTASAKVYCLRVDDVYTDVIRLAGSLGHRGNSNKNNEENEESDNNHLEGNDEGVEASQRARMKKKKKGKSKTTTNPEALIGDVDLLDTAHPIFAELNTRSGDIIGTDNMFQVFAPLNSQISEYDIRTNEQFFDSTIMKRTDPAEMEFDEDIKKIILPLSLQSSTAINSLKICSTFSEFSLTNWSPDEEEEISNSQKNKTIVPSTADQINLAFDINAEPQEIMDVTMEDAGDPRSYSSDEEIVQEANVEANINLPTALAGCKPQIENIVDMRPSHPNNTRNLEYSYNSIASGIWAGPAHWKIKSIIHRTQPRLTVQHAASAEANTKKRKTKVVKIVMSYEELHEDKEHEGAKQPFLKCSEHKLKMATVCSWDKNKNELPIDLHVTSADTLKLFINNNWSLVPQERPASALSIENNHYDYNNLNDSAFCNPPDPELLDNDDNNENEHEYSDHEINHGDVFASVDHGEEDDILLTGENLLPAPRIIPKLFVPYSTRAKKVNMKVIKHSMWNVITRNTDEGNNENVNNLNTENNVKEVTETKFSTIIEKLPGLLPRDQAANISVALAFFGLLHLANENTLKLMGDNELKDVIINKG